MDLPSGTLTFLFSDVEGSTQLLERHGAVMGAALARHHVLFEDIVERHDGAIFETVGDAVYVVFARPDDAIAAALDAQRALGAEDWGPIGRVAVRIALHTGQVERRGDHYFGPALFRAARLQALGHGEQTLLSGVTARLVADALPHGASLRDLGTHRLKDLGEPEQVFQLVHPELRPDFPALKSLDAHPHNLPIQLSSFVGRDAELAELSGLLNQHRLVTLLGPGGIGKTRLALQAAAQQIQGFADGVWFVDLSALRDPELVPGAIAASLGLHEQPGHSIRVTLAEHLHTKRLLLVLDNLEQLLPAGASGIAELLSAAADLNLLVTSRAPLRVRGEREFPVPPLAAGASDRLEAEPPPAVALFVDRARAIKPNLEVTSESGPLIAAICQRLDGLPLAIELAAARLRLFTTAQLHERLTERLPLLTGGARDLPERQQTLRAAIEWSYELLSSRERRLFVFLAVFVGGFGLDAAEAVCEADVDTLQSLVDKSLLQADGDRFRMLETLREFASRSLETSNELEQLRRRHAEYYLALAERAEPELTGADQPVWLERLAVEYGNLRVALEWCAATPASAVHGLRLAAALVFFWYVRGPYPEGLNWLERMLEVAQGEPPESKVGSLWGAGLLWALVGDSARALPLLEQSLGLARSLGDHSRVARSLNVLGLLAFFRNDYAGARELLEESVDKARRAGDIWCLTDALGTLGSIYPLQGKFELAERAASEALMIARRNADRQGIRMALFGLALAGARRGDLAAARRLGEEGLSVCREIGDRWFVSYFLWILATVATASGDYATARNHADESLAVARETEGPLLLVCSLEASAAVARAEGDAEGAGQQLTEAEVIGRGGSVPHSYVVTVLRSLGELAAAHDDIADATVRFEEGLSLAREVGDRWSAARSLSCLAALAEQRHDVERSKTLAGDALTLELEIGDQLGIAEVLERLASIALVESRAQQAAALLGAADGIRERAGAAVSPWARARHAELVRRIRRAVGPGRYKAFIREGRDFSLDALYAQAREITERHALRRGAASGP
ncbi:MAG: tetratricopeptide repeat protein [Chloroflexota bacterium]|nr:tetratricopeptide repeat protein [Chloroflexota bacterium]